MGLPGKAIEKIMEAIKSAFTGRDKLVMMLRTQLDIKESDIPNHSDYNQVVFDLIIKLEQEERIPDLIKGGLKEVPGNLKLQNLPGVLIRLLNKNDDKLKIIYWKINIVFLLYVIIFNLASANKDYINQIKQIYSNCCSEKLYEDWEDTTPNTVAEILDNLEKMSQNSEMEPIIKFAACLLEGLLQKEKNHNPKIEQLKTWVENNANNYSELLTQIKRNNTSNNASETIERYLILLIEPSIQETKNSLYIVKSWVIEGKDLRYKSLDITYQKKEKFSFEEIPSLLSYFIEQSIQQLKNLPTTIEFFLPHELFNQAVDAFIPEKFVDEEDDDELPIPIGVNYNVSIRSYQRIKKLLKNKCRDEKIIRWQEKWKTLNSRREELCCPYFISGDNWREIFSELQSVNAVGLKLFQVPSKDILKAIDQTGTPVALWLRTELNNSDFLIDFEAILQECSITELPNKIKNERLVAFKQEIHIGKHITLLWDNPNILPPEVLPASLPEVLH